MYVQVASYRLGLGSTADLATRVKEGNLPIVRDVPGFLGYYAFEVGDGVVASVLLFDDKSGVEEAEKLLADWIERTSDEFQVTPLGVLEGKVIASSN